MFFIEKIAQRNVQITSEGIWNICYGSQSKCYAWYKEFKESRTSAELKGGPSAPKTKLSEIIINTGAAIVREDSRITLRQLASILDISVGSAHHLLTEDLNLSRICARWIPRLLTGEQKANRVSICEQLREKVRRDPEYLDNVITADETWIYMYDPETKQQSTQWVEKGGPPPKKARGNKSAAKTMIITFFNKEGMVYNHVVPNKQTVNAQYYVDVLRKLIRPHIQRKRPQYTKGRWKLHRDNARPHTAKVVTEFLEERKIEIVPHPPYSPDLAPCDFHLYPTLKKNIKGRRFDSAQAALDAVQGILKRMSEEGFQGVYEKWQERWLKCIKLGGEYIEREIVDLDENM